MKCSLVFAAVMALVSCIGPVTAPAAASLPTARVRLPDVIRVQVKGRVLAVPLEEYVLGSALSEVSPINDAPSAVEEIFELQSILARTYAAAHLARHRAEGFNLCDTTHCQLYEPGRITTSRFSAIARRAVDRTRDRILVFEGKPIDALFHSDCGGHTAAADEVWGGEPVPYLIGTPDLAGVPHRSWRFAAPLSRLRAALNADARSAVGRRLDTIRVTHRDDSGRATDLEVRGEQSHELRGEALRAILNQTFGDRAIQSTRFSVARAGATITFDGTGFGHGVGLCQVGAAARARRGDSIEAILAAYFPGAVLQVGQ